MNPKVPEPNLSDPGWKMMLDPANEIIAGFVCKDIGTALALIAWAKTHDMKASYHPQGGDLPTRHVPVTHRVYVTGQYGQLIALRHMIKENYEQDINEIP